MHPSPLSLYLAVAITMIHNTVPRANPSEGLVPLLQRHRTLWDSPEAGYPKHRGAPPSWRLNTRSAPLAGALPHRHSMRRTPPYAQAAAARDAQNGETSDVAPAPKMFAFMVYLVDSPPEPATTMPPAKSRIPSFISQPLPKPNARLARRRSGATGL